MSKKSPSAPAPGPAETTQAAISKQMYDVTDPLRNLWINEFMKQWGYAPGTSLQNLSASGGVPAQSGNERLGGKIGQQIQGQGGQSYSFTGQPYDPRQNPLYQPLYNVARESTNQGYQQARDAILANTPRGGGQARALGELETGMAKERANVPFLITQQIMNDLMQKGYGTAFGAPQQALAGLTGATAAEIQRNNAALQAQTATNAGKKNTGAALGMIAASGGLFAPAAAGAAGTTSLAGFAPASGWAAPTAFFS